MIGTTTALPERSVEEVQPMPWKVLVEWTPDEWKSKHLVRPESSSKDMKHTQAIKGVIARAGEKAHKVNPSFKVGQKVVVDPSIDVMGSHRAFKSGDKHYFLCDASDIIALF